MLKYVTDNDGVQQSPIGLSTQDIPSSLASQFKCVSNRTWEVLAGEFDSLRIFPYSHSLICLKIQNQAEIDTVYFYILKIFF